MYDRFDPAAVPALTTPAFASAGFADGTPDDCEFVPDEFSPDEEAEMERLFAPALRRQQREDGRPAA